MKKIVFIWGLVVLIACSCAQQKSADKTVLGLGTDYMYYPETLHGKIKKLTETNYWAVDNDGKITKGNPMTWKDLDSVGSTKNIVAEFDDKGSLTRYDLLDENNVIRYSTIGIQENGRYTKLLYKIKDSTAQYQITDYDSRGYISGGKMYNAKTDTVLFTFKFNNNDKGNYTKIEFFNPKGLKGSSQVFALNEDGKVIEAKFFNKYDTLRQTFLNSYDEKGSLIKQTVKIERPASSITWNMKDLLLDDHGNWLQGYSIIENGKFKLFVERTYVYY
jgi:hypothetical protein